MKNSRRTDLKDFFLITPSVKVRLFLWYPFFVPEIFKFSYYANLVTDDVMGCASSVQWQDTKLRISPPNNEEMLLKLCRVCTLQNIPGGTHFDVAMATCLVSVSCLFKIKYYHLRLNKANYLVLSKTFASPTFHWVSSLTFFVHFAPSSYKWCFWFWGGKRLEPSMLPYQHQNVYHLVYFVGCNIPAKFQ